MRRLDYERSGVDEDADVTYTFFYQDGPITLTEHELVNGYMNLREASEARDRPTDPRSIGQEGMVTVFDAEGRYIGCMGIETWERLLAARTEERTP